MHGLMTLTMYNPFGVKKCKLLRSRRISNNISYCIPESVKSRSHPLIALELVVGFYVFKI